MGQASCGPAPPCGGLLLPVAWFHPSPKKPRGLSSAWGLVPQAQTCSLRPEELGTGRGTALGTSRRGVPGSVPRELAPLQWGVGCSEAVPLGPGSGEMQMGGFSGGAGPRNISRKRTGGAVSSWIWAPWPRVFILQMVASGRGPVHPAWASGAWWTLWCTWARVLVRSQV